MHLPNPLGSYPMVLRDYKTHNPIKGELLLDYTKYDLYYCSRTTGKLESVTNGVYNTVIEQKTIATPTVVKDLTIDTDYRARNDEYVYPERKDRVYNSINFFTYKKINGIKSERY